MKKNNGKDIYDLMEKNPKREEYFRVLLSRKNKPFNKQQSDLVLLPFIIVILLVIVSIGSSILNSNSVTGLSENITKIGLLVFGLLAILGIIYTEFRSNKSMKNKQEKLSNKYGRTDIENIIVQYKNGKHNRRFFGRLNNKRYHYKERYYIYKYECRMTYYDYQEMESREIRYSAEERNINNYSYSYETKNSYILYEYDFNRLNKKLDKKKLESESFQKYLEKIRKYKWIKSVDILNNRLKVVKEIVKRGYEEVDLNNDIDDVEKFYKDLSKELLK